jgi:dihydroflavonol-4-reductase
VYASSVHVFVEPHEGSIDEDTAIDPARVVGHYAKTKAKATLAVLEAARGDIDAVVVAPSGVVGPFDHRPSEMGQVLVDFARGRIPIAVHGGYDFVDVRDVAHALITAGEKGRRGEVYLVTGRRISVKELMGTLGEITGRRPPSVYLPLRVARPLSHAAMLYYRATRTRALFTPYAVHTLGARYTVRDDKARRELGHHRLPLADSLRDAWEWLLANGASDGRRKTATAVA